MLNKLDQVLAALQDAYKYYMGQARLHRHDLRESKIWQDKAIAVETLALTLQRR